MYYKCNVAYFKVKNGLLYYSKDGSEWKQVPRSDTDKERILTLCQDLLKVCLSRYIIGDSDFICIGWRGSVAF